MPPVEPWVLAQRQELPLDMKIQYSKRRIQDWYNHWRGQVYVSFSGGKDSTVLLHMARELYPGIPAVFADTGLEYPEIRDFVKTVDNVTWIKPAMTFGKVIERYGYPIVSKEQSMAISRYRNTKDPIQKHRRIHGWPSKKKEGTLSKVGTISQKWLFLKDADFKISNRCCDIMKKKPLERYTKESGRSPMVAIMTAESRGRKILYLKQGCNPFSNKKPISWPMAFWRNEDVWEYLRRFNVPYSKIYDMGERRTGCMFCMFGVHLEDEPNRFQRMKKTHPKLWKYCMEKLGLKKPLETIGVPYE